MISQEDLREIQLVQLQIMDEIHRVCVKNHIKYYLIGGSALGAVRHKGFIPWDADIDIALPRKDYERFVLDCSRELNDQLVCEDYRSNRRHRVPHALVILKNSEMVYKTDHLQIPIFVDLLPLDQVPSDETLQRKQEKRLKRIKKIINIKRLPIYSQNNAFVRSIKHIIHFLLAPLSLRWLNERQQRIAQMFDSLPESECSLCCSTLSHYKYSKLCMDKSFFGTPVLAEFEGRRYCVPCKVKDYLHHLFGDYMKLPPATEQDKERRLILRAEWTFGNKTKTIENKVSALE